MELFSYDDNPDSFRYGDKFWTVETPNGWINLCADEINLSDGHLVAYCHNSKNERFIGLCFPPGEWFVFWAASVLDGSPIVIDSCRQLKNGINENNGSRRKRFSKKVREMMFDKAGYKCQSCQQSEADGVELHIDHIIPLAMGGTNNIRNLQVLCNHCNSAKSDYLE